MISGRPGTSRGGPGWVPGGGKGGGKPPPWDWRFGKYTEFEIGRREKRTKDLHARPEGSADFLKAMSYFDAVIIG